MHLCSPCSKGRIFHSRHQLLNQHGIIKTHCRENSITPQQLYGESSWLLHRQCKNNSQVGYQKIPATQKCLGTERLLKQLRKSNQKNPKYLIAISKVQSSSVLTAFTSFFRLSSSIDLCRSLNLEKYIWYNQTAIATPDFINNHERVHSLPIGTHLQCTVFQCS